MTPDEMSEWVAASRAEQGLPRYVENPDILAAIAAILKDARRIVTS